MKKMRMLKNFQKNGNEAFRTIQPYYIYEDHAIKIVDQKMYDGINGKEGIAFTRKNRRFFSIYKRMEKT